MYKKIATLVLLPYIAMGLVACAALSPEAVVSPPREDAVVMAKIKSQLIEDAAIGAAAIRVVSDAGVVTLDGFVDNPAQKKQAESLALDVEGVTRVDNQLQIR